MHMYHADAGKKKPKQTHGLLTSDACMSWLRVRCALQSAPSLNEDQGGWSTLDRFFFFFGTGLHASTRIFPPPPP